MTIIRREQLATFEQSGPAVVTAPVDHVKEAIERVRASRFGQSAEGKALLANLPVITFAPMSAARASWVPGTLTVNERYKDDPDAIAAELVYGAPHARAAESSADTAGSRGRQLDFYEEQRERGFRDPELEEGRRARASGSRPSEERGEATKVHAALPEPVLFLRLAARALEQYHARTGAYPREWAALDVTFAGGPYRISDPNVRPGPASGDTWRPDRCEHTYRITVEKDHPRVHALNAAGVVVYHIDPDMEDPRPGAS